MTQHHYLRVRTGGGRRECITISGASSDKDVETRKRLIRRVADELVAGGRPDRVRALCSQLGAAGSQKLLDLICSAVKDLLIHESAPPDSVTFAGHARDWTSGDLHKRFPDYVGTKDSKDDAAKLRLYINPVVGPIPLVKLRLEDGQRVMRLLPPGLSSASRRHVAQVMYKALRYAVFPCKILEHNPLPPGFLPRLEAGKAKQYLYPDEDAKLLRCKKIPLEYRLAYGVLAREGMRTSELVGSNKRKTPAIPWSAFDLARGMISLDKNKTKAPRAWALDPFVVKALIAWKKLVPKAPFDHIDPNRFAPRFRAHLELAEVDREELTAKSTKERRPIVAHDLRATFITVSLANGKTEAWIEDRTGHTSSAMLNRYRRLARQFNELGLGTLRPLDALLVDLPSGQKVGKSLRPNRKQVA